jgi:hypothetical protein
MKLFTNIFHINTECSCDKCSVQRIKQRLYASRSKLNALILAEIRALSGQKKSVNSIANDIAGKIELFFSEEGV